MFFLFFQAEDGIRYGHVTGVQTCALPISMTSTMTATFASTTVVSTRADSLVPVTTRAVRSSSSTGAIRLTFASGALYVTTKSGNPTPKPSIVATKYADQTRATIAAAVTSSRTSAQPTSHAQISPNAT